MNYDYIIVGSGLASIMFAEQLRLHNKSFIVIMYVPSSNSDLFKLNVETKHDNNTEHSLLFKSNEFDKFNPNADNLGNDLFNNHTRVQRNED